MIILDKIYHGYKEKLVLDDFSLHLPANKISCIMGNSGCGKTTILRIIAGLETPLRGNVKIDGVEVTAGGKILVPPYKRNLAFVFQDLALWPHFTVYENVAFGLKEKSEKNIPEKVNAILDFLGIAGKAKRFPHQLSGGQKQLVAIARAVVVRPRILLMDEPMANLDTNLKSKLLDYVLKLRDDLDLTIVYVTHDRNEATLISENIIELDADGV